MKKEEPNTEEITPLAHQIYRHRAIPTHPRSSKLGLTYLDIAYPRSRSFKAQLAAWQDEHARVLRVAPELPVTL